jgi:hypothetical protein
MDPSEYDGFYFLPGEDDEWEDEDDNVKELKGQLAYLNEEFDRLLKLYQEQQNNENIIRGMIDNFEVRLRIIQQLNKYLEIQKNKESHDQKNA